MVNFIVSAFATSFFIVLLSEVVVLRLWKAPVSMGASTLFLYLMGEKFHKEMIVLVCASSFLSVFLVLIVDRLVTPPLPPAPLARK